MPDLTAMTPGEIETAIAAIYQRAAPVSQRLRETSASIRRYENAGWKRERYQYLLDRADQARAQQTAILAETAPFDAEFDRRGQWSRFFLCLSDGGHVHLRWCATLRPTSSIGWLPELSGKTEADMVMQFGPKACTVCFPSAPLLPGYADRAAEQEATAAEKRVEAGRCIGTGTVNPTHRYGQRYGRCPACQQVIGVSEYGKIRPHKYATKVAR